VTLAFLIFIAVLLIAYDVAAPYLGQPTESKVLRSLSREWTVLPAAMGVLLGHWWSPSIQIGVSGWAYACAALVPVLGADIGYRYLGKGADLWWRSPLLYVALGVPIGAVLWSQ